MRRFYEVVYVDADGRERYSRAFRQVRNARRWAKRIAAEIPGVVRVEVRRHD